MVVGGIEAAFQFRDHRADLAGVRRAGRGVAPGPQDLQPLRVIEAAVRAARIRLRPILMTSFAFIFGVLPLAISTGAGANSRIAIGTSVIGGMLTASLLAIFYIPLFFVLVRRSTRDALKAVRERLKHSDDSEQPA